MTEKDLESWFLELIASAREIAAEDNGMFCPITPVARWLVAAHSALVAGFPPGHSVFTAWDAIGERAKGQKYGQVPLTVPHASLHFRQYCGVVESALELVQQGRLQGVFEGVKAETVTEVLDQAEALLKANHRVAAAVLAGGALETHLLHLCRRNTLKWLGDGSIGKYNDAISQARNAGNEIYGATLGKLIGAWGGIRNDAAHDPTNFPHSDGDVRSMILGIRDLMVRVP